MKVSEILTTVISVQKIDPPLNRHNATFDLYRDVLRALADGAKGAKDMAAAALMLETE